MKTQQDVLAAYQNGRKSQCLDGREISRLVNYLPVAVWDAFGCELKEGAPAPEVLPWTEERFEESLRTDLAFAIEKSEGCRGISASLMFEVVKMWLWVLDDPLGDTDDYYDYGLPFFNEVADQYGFPKGERAKDED